MKKVPIKLCLMKIHVHIQSPIPCVIYSRHSSSWLFLIKLVLYCMLSFPSDPGEEVQIEAGWDLDGFQSNGGG